MNRRHFIGFLRLFAAGVFSCFGMTAWCQQPVENPADTLMHFSVRPAPEWTGRFYRNEGWFGADGIFTMTLSGNESIGAGSRDSVLMYFSDTMTGTVVGDSAVQDFKMVNNSIAWVTGLRPSEETVKLQVNRGPDGSFTSYFAPHTPHTQPGEYYWFGDGFVNAEDHHSINIFGYRVYDNSPQSWDFSIRGVTLITLPAGSQPPFARQEQIDLPLYIDQEGLGKGTFGAGVYVNTDWAGAPDPDGYVYVYGVLEPNKQLVVARVLPAALRDAGAWRFWTGKDWSPDIRDVRPVTNRVSNELSLTPLADGRYLLVFQEDGIGAYTDIRLADSPVGPFGPAQRVWQVPELSEPPGIIPYNAKAHPVLSNTGELLISYNTISLDYFNDILRHPHMYRPRFFWLKVGE